MIAEGDALQIGVGQDNRVWKISKIDQKMYKAFGSGWSKIGEASDSDE